jgi:hypothetical protein
MAGQPSVVDLAQGILHDAERLVRLEIELAKEEAKELAIRNGVAIGLLVGAGVSLFLSIPIFFLVWVVEFVPWHWQAAAIIAGCWLFLAILLGLVGILRIRFPKPKETRTVSSLMETREWLQRQISNGK